MRCLIIYFSLTGNTKKIAEAIWAGIRESIECDIAKIKEVEVKNLVKYDLIGLGSPVHFYEPANVTKFIKSMTDVNGKHLFLFCTHATRPEAFLPSILEALQPKGMLAIGYGHWYGSFNDQQFPKPYLTDGHPDEIDLKEAGEFGREMVERSKRISDGETSLIPHSNFKRRISLILRTDNLLLAMNHLHGDSMPLYCPAPFRQGGRFTPKGWPTLLRKAGRFAPKWWPV